MFFFSTFFLDGHIAFRILSIIDGPISSLGFASLDSRRHEPCRRLDEEICMPGLLETKPRSSQYLTTQIK